MIRIADKKICLSCHIKIHIHGNKKIDYSQNPFHGLIFSKNRNLESDLKRYVQNINENEEASRTVKMDLFVMSMCPYGIMAEEKIFQLIKRYKNILDFDIYFIADDLLNMGISKSDGKENLKIEEDIPAVEEILPFKTCLATKDNNEDKRKKDDRYLKDFHLSSEG